MRQRITKEKSDANDQNQRAQPVEPVRADQRLPILLRLRHSRGKRLFRLRRDRHRERFRNRCGGGWFGLRLWGAGLEHPDAPCQPPDERFLVTETLLQLARPCGQNVQSIAEEYDSDDKDYRQLVSHVAGTRVPP